MGLQRGIDVDVAAAPRGLRDGDGAVQIVDPAAARIRPGHRDIRPRQIVDAGLRVMGVDIENIADRYRWRDRIRPASHVRQIEGRGSDCDTRRIIIGRVIGMRIAGIVGID